MEPYVLPSARKHGVTDGQILHAYRNAVDFFLEDDLMVVIGSDETGLLLEVGFSRSRSGRAVVHAMPTRRKYLRGRA